MSNKLNVLYAAGPGNVIGTFTHWLEKKDDPSQVSMTFSGQFYDVIDSLDAKAYVISSYADRKKLRHGDFSLEHRPVPFSNRSGLIYYLGQVMYGLSLVISALKFKADVVVVSDASYYPILSILPKLGVQVVPTLHCVLFPKYAQLSRFQKFMLKLDALFFKYFCLAIMSTSDDINSQVNKITNGSPKPIINFLSTYRQEEFEKIAQPSEIMSPFQVLFAGRIEKNKGVFDLLEIAKQFKDRGYNNIIFNICGNGSELTNLKTQVKSLGLESSFICHGYCNKPKMREMFGLSHVVIVPTKSDFVEGLNQVVIEGVLSGRPVITSSVCPALSYVKEAVLEVPPDDIDAYAEAILSLSQDPILYKVKQESCGALQGQFYDVSRSWGHALKLVLTSWMQQEGKCLAGEYSSINL